jgi:hypothetical protein
MDDNSRLVVFDFAIRRFDLSERSDRSAWSGSRHSFMNVGQVAHNISVIKGKKKK